MAVGDERECIAVIDTNNPELKSIGNCHQPAGEDAKAAEARAVTKAPRGPGPQKKGDAPQRKETNPNPIMLENNTGRGGESKSKSTLDPRRIDPRSPPQLNYNTDRATQRA